MASRMQQRLLELIGTPSPTGEETAVVDLITGWVSDLPETTIDRWTDTMGELEDDPAYPGREVEREEVPVVAASFDTGRPGPTVVLTGHVDTVAIGDRSRWSKEPSGERDGDRVYGRGACDMKAGIVAALEAFARISEDSSGLVGEVRFVAVPGEEDGGTGTLSAIRRGWSGDHVIITEPTSSGDGPDVVVAHGGALTLGIEVKGHSAHGSVPHEGESALDHFITTYRAMREIEAEVNGAVVHPQMSKLAVPHATTVGVVRGGWWASNVMERLVAEVRVGVPVGQTTNEALETFTASLHGRLAGDPWLSAHPPKVDLIGAAFGSSTIPTDHPLVAVVRDAAEKVTGRRPEPIGVPYGCDMALWRTEGKAAAVVYGPGDVAHAHAPDEWVSLREVEETVEVLVEVVRRLLAS